MCFYQPQCFNQREELFIVLYVQDLIFIYTHNHDKQTLNFNV